MKFKLEIEMGNAAMLTADDIEGALGRVQLGDPKIGEQGKIRDLNGNPVGSWKFIRLRRKK